jgi:zinc protease
MSGTMTTGTVIVGTMTKRTKMTTTKMNRAKMTGATLNTLKIFSALLLLASFAAAQKEVPLPKDLPPYGPEKPLQSPPVKLSTLANGLSVWLVSEPGFPKVALTIAVRGGFSADPAGRPGISKLLSNTIDQGTLTRSARQVAQELQAAGGDLAAEAYKDSITVSTTLLSSRLDAGVGVLADIVENANFPDAEVALAKRNLADWLEQQEAEPAFLAERARDKLLFAGHPYSVIAPTSDSISASSSAELRAIFAQRFRPDQAMLVAVGDFDNDKMLALVNSTFGAWKSPATAPLAPIPSPATTIEHSVFVVPRPGSIQTTIELATFAPKRGDPDYEAACVANAIYGGTFSSRLTTNIREDKGYTYSPYSEVDSFRKGAELITHADVRNEVTGPTLNEIEYELNRMATTSPTQEELSKTKRYLVGSEALRLQARAPMALRLAGLWVDDLTSEQIGIYGQRVAAMTAADVDAAAKKYFPAYRTVIVAVGEEKVIREAVAPLGLTMRTLP